MQNKNSNLADIRHKREDVYIKALGISLYKISLDESEESKKNNELITSKVYEIAPLMMVYASKKVLILYKQIQKVAEDGYSKVVEGRLFDRLESEIRRELDVDD